MANPSQAPAAVEAAEALAGKAAQDREAGEPPEAKGRQASDAGRDAASGKTGGEGEERKAVETKTVETKPVEAEPIKTQTVEAGEAKSWEGWKAVQTEAAEAIKAAEAKSGDDRHGDADHGNAETKAIEAEGGEASEAAKTNGTQAEVVAGQDQRRRGHGIPPKLPVRVGRFGQHKDE